jgi:hypothetical protein
LLYVVARRFLSHEIAFASAVLFSLSPLVRAWLTQPDVTIFTAFMWMLFLWLFIRYADAPSKKRLYGYSAVVGILFLGKLFFLMSIFAVVAAVYFKRYREGAIFFAVHLVPVVIWVATVTRLWGLSYPNREVTEFGAGIWIIYFLMHSPGIFLEKSLVLVPRFIESAIYAFMMLPLPLAVYGFMRTAIKRKYFYVFGVLGSLFAMVFVMGYSIPRYAFLLFPIIYPLAALGLQRVAERINHYCPQLPSRLVWCSGFFIMILLAGMDVVKFYRYMGFPLD